jgi:hypothetical protein
VLVACILLVIFACPSILLFAFDFALGAIELAAVNTDKYLPKVRPKNHRIHQMVL